MELMNYKSSTKMFARFITTEKLNSSRTVIRDQERLLKAPS